MGLGTGDIDNTGYQPDDRVSATRRLQMFDPTSSGNAATTMLVAALNSGERVSLDALAGHLVKEFGIPRDQALRDVARFTAQGTATGLLSLHSTAARSLTFHYLRPVVRFVKDPLGIGEQRLASRRHYYLPTLPRLAALASASQLTLAVLVAVALTLGILLVLFNANPLDPNPLQQKVAVTFAVTFVVAMTAGGVLHEVAHLLMARLASVPVKDIYAQGLQVGLRREAATPGRDLAVTLAGPLMGVLLCAIGGVWLWQTYPLGDPRVAVRPALLAVLIVGLYHTSCLIPPAADGVAISRAVARRSAERAQEP